MQKVMTGICILLLIAIGWVWVRSYHVYDHFIYLRRQPIFYRSVVMWGLTSDMGRCRFEWEEFETPIAEGFAHGTEAAFVWNGDQTFMNKLGFGWGSGQNVLIQGQNISYESVVVPFWGMAAAVLALPPASWVIARRRRRKQAAGAAPRRSWVDHPQLRPLVTPLIALIFALLAGFCAVVSAIDLVIMLAGLVPPQFLFFVLPVVMSVVTVRLWRLRRRLKRRNAGLCETCGYDVRASESGMCPECGTVIPASTS
jgi:hypothetical protein